MYLDLIHRMLNSAGSESTHVHPPHEDPPPHYNDDGGDDDDAVCQRLGLCGQGESSVRSTGLQSPSFWLM